MDIDKIFVEVDKTVWHNGLDVSMCAYFGDSELIPSVDCASFIKDIC